MPALEGAVSTIAPDEAQPRGGMLRCGGNQLKSGSPRTRARVDARVAEEAARRVGTLAILTALTVVGIAVLQDALQAEVAAAPRTPLFRLSALSLVLASIGLAALQRSKAANAQMLLDIGLGFEVAGALAIGLMENSLPW